MMRSAIFNFGKTSLLISLLCAGGCKEGFLSTSVSNRILPAASVITLDESNETSATLSASATELQTVSTSASNISGSSLIMPVRALALDINLSIEEGASTDTTDVL